MIILFLLFVLSSSQCFFPIGKLQPINNVRTCVKAVKADPDNMQTVLQSVRDSLELYAFRDIVAKPIESPLIHIAVDIRSRLDQIGRSDFGIDFNFHQSINNLFVDLHDPHTVYAKPDCYSFYMLAPLALSSRLNSDGMQEIFVKGTLKLFSGSKWDSKYDNMTVSEIDGVDAMQVLESYALHNTFISKDLGTSFNAAVQSQFVERNALISDFPLNNSMTWTLKAGDSTSIPLEIPWYVYPTGSLNLTGGVCSSANAEASKQKKAWREAGVPLSRRELFGMDNAAAESESTLTFTNITEDTMLLRISSFEPDNATDFMLNLTQGIVFATQNNISNLLIDLSRNGGGDICLGYSVIRQLMNELHPVRSSQSSSQLFTCSRWARTT